MSLAYCHIHKTGPASFNFCTWQAPSTLASVAKSASYGRVPMGTYPGDYGIPWKWIKGARRINMGGVLTKAKSVTMIY